MYMQEVVASRRTTMLYVQLNLGDIVLTKPIIVESVRHTLSQGLHTMDLTVKGDDIADYSVVGDMSAEEKAEYVA